MAVFVAQAEVPAGGDQDAPPRTRIAYSVKAKYL